MIGKTVAHYRVLEKIGSGGMGEVYRALDTRLGREVALKVLPPALVADEERQLRLQREAQAAAALNHPNICTIHEAGSREGVDYLVMELLEGETLRERIGHTAMPLKTLLPIAIQVGEAMVAAHERKVLHRDLKPENIFITTQGVAKVLDFGLAKILEPAPGPGSADLHSRLATLSRELTLQGRVFGTVAYMSPEQATGGTITQQSDLFSFGIVLYEMATGRQPFKGKTSAETLASIIKDDPPPASAVSGEEYLDLDRIIARCLEKDPRERAHHADELVAELRRLKRVTDSDVQAIRDRATRGAGPRSASIVRRPAVLAGVGAVGLVAALALVVGLDVGGMRSWLAGGGGMGEAPGRGVAAPGRITSLAVLPLRNVAGDSSQDFFADGMTDELTTTLSRIRSLRVISSTSAMQYKRARKPVPEIAKELGVDAVIEGSVLRAGDRVRITAQLVEAATDRNLWAASYERDLRDVLALQAEVARAIANEIKAALTPEETSRLAGAGPVDPEAYQHYLAGRYQQGKRTTEGGLTKAIEEYKRSIEKDPNYAPAYAGLADTYGLLPAWSLMRPEEAYPRAKEAALKALEIDDGLAEAHAALARIRADSEWDWQGAEAEYKRAIDLNPNYAWAHMMYGLYLSALGRDEAAVAEMRQAQRLDPVSSIINRNFGLVHCNAHRYDQALALYGRVLELDPHFMPALMDRAGVRIDSGMYEEGIAELLKLENDPSAELAGVLAYLARGYGLLGRKPEALATIGKLTRLAERQYAPSAYIALAYAGVGDLDRSLAILEKAVRERDPNMIGLKVQPAWDPLRSDPRFKDLLRRVGFPPD